MVLKPEKEQEPRRSSANGGSTSRWSVRPRRPCVSSWPPRRGEATFRSRSSATRRRSTIGPTRRYPSPRAVKAADVTPPVATADALVRLIGSPDLCSKRWVWESTTM